MFLKSLVKVLSAAALVAAAVSPVQAQQFFRIGTGGTAGTYYPVGGMIANLVTQPGKLIASAVASNGSVANVNGIMGGSLESGFSQSDVAYWAYTGTGTFEGKAKAADLRLIATLYPESIHLVVRKGSGIKSVADLRGKRVSMDEPGSGTLVDVRLIMGA
jgi:TRAP transporter TAXI family solute receptor